MNMEITISTAGSRKDVFWKQEKLLWHEFIDRLKNPSRSAETLDEYMKLPKVMQDNLKDVGGYVAGELRDGRRKNTNLVKRDLITIDLDNIEPGRTKDVIDKIKSLNVTFVVHSTRKHAEYKPRLRVVFLADRSMTPDEYEPVARKIGQMVGIEMCDPSTFEPARLMYWPSCSKDSTYVYVHEKDKPALSIDGVLGMYYDWKNMAEWPQVPGSEKIEERLLKKQENPLEKTGLVGAFCKTFSIVSAVLNFIPDVYDISDDGSRMTYTEGSTFGGAVIYDDVFVYSHHATDPAGGKLCNAFDMVRIHKFGDMDYDVKDGTPINRLPSFVEMSKFARGIKGVAEIVNAERYNASDEFDMIEDVSDGNNEWMNRFDVNENGVIRKTINNMLLVLKNDPKLKEKFAIDEFANRAMVLGKLPWDLRDEVRQFEEADGSGIRNYLEKKYGLTGENKVNDALILVSNKRKLNRVREYLENLKWDGNKRIGTLLHDYLGADKDVYTAAVMKVSLTAAVARAIDGGIKYDYMPIFTGAQGIGKSTFLAKLGGEWYSDSLQTFEGKDAAEMIQGTWINELGELTGFNRSETNLIKQFLSKQDDIFRKAYGRVTEKYPRRCVFFGTSNDYEFLRDNTGNRRFWPVEVGKHDIKKSIWKELDCERDQIWAEAYTYYIIGEDLFLSDEALETAKEKQEEHRISNTKEGIIREFLEMKIPEDWHTWDAEKRRNYYSGFNTEGIKTAPRDRVCAIEILIECFEMKKAYIKNSDSLEINGILNNMPGWERTRSKRFGPYGNQRGFQKVHD